MDNTLSLLQNRILSLAKEDCGEWAGLPTSLPDLYERIRQSGFRSNYEELREALLELYASGKIVLQKFWTHDMRWVLYQHKHAPDRFFWGQFRVFVPPAVTPANAYWVD